MRARNVLVSIGLTLPLAASADPLDCNDMAPVVSEMLVERMRLPEYLALGIVEAADAAFRVNYLHAERREYRSAFCSAVIRFDPIRFAEAERQAARVDSALAVQGLAPAAAGGLARYADFPDGIKVRYRLELADNGRAWVVILVGDPATEHICALPDRHRYLEDDRPCSSPPGEHLQWRRSGSVDAGQFVPGR